MENNYVFYCKNQRQPEIAFFGYDCKQCILYTDKINQSNVLKILCSLNGNGVVEVP